MSNVQEALKAAIEALLYGTNTDEAVELCKAALADIEKCEPVGWYCKACKETGLSHCSDPENCGGMVRTYTSPQPRDWVGLSDKDFEYYVNIRPYENLEEHTLAISERLKQLNTKG